MIKWSDAYNTGNAIIDAQHKRLLEIAGEIELLFKDEYTFDKYDEIMNKLKSLKDYTSYHFTCEENLMKASTYADFDAHKILHENCLDTIDEFLSRNVDNEQEAVLKETLHFVVDWIINHIFETDKNMSQSLM